MVLYYLHGTAKNRVRWATNSIVDYEIRFPNTLPTPYKPFQRNLDKIQARTTALQTKLEFTGLEGGLYVMW